MSTSPIKKNDDPIGASTGSAPERPQRDPVSLRTLASLILGITVLMLAALAREAAHTDQWRGFAVSGFQLVVTAGVLLLILRPRS